MNFNESTLRLLFHEHRLASFLKSGFPSVNLPIQYELELTRHTNLALGNTGKPKTPVIELPYSSAVSILRQIANTGAKSLVIGGRGEPSLFSNCAGLIQIAGELNLDVCFQTNALFMPDTLVNALFRFCRLIVINFDAATAETYARVHGVAEDNFNLVLNNVKRLLKRKRRNGSKTKLIGRFKLLESNSLELEKFAKLLADLGFDEIHYSSTANPLTSFSCDEKPIKANWEYLPEEGVDCPCYCGLFHAFISSSEEVFFCRLRTEELYGDLSKSLLATILLSEQRKSFLANSNCKDCSLCSLVRFNSFMHQLNSCDKDMRNFFFESWKL